MKKAKRFSWALLSGVIASSLWATSVFAAPLQAINHSDWMVKKQILSPSKDGRLFLERNITLGEAVTVMAKLKGGSSKTAIPGLKHWSAPYLAWAKDHAAVNVEEAKKPNQTVSSAKLSEMAKKLGFNVTLPNKAQVTRGEFFQALGDAITTHITIGHTNDTHGHIEENVTGKEFGFAKIATILKQWREENKNFLLLDAGDAFQGTVFADQFKGESIVPIRNSLGYNAMAAGNHEFDFGYEQLLKLRDMSNYPIVSANVFKADGSELLVPTYFAEIGGQKFAFIGFVTDETPILTHPDNVKGLTFKKPVDVAKVVVPKLKQQVDHVVVVSHVGIDADREMAKNVSGIDLIVGGHSHTALRAPEVVNGTYIVQDWEYGKSVGRADLFYYGKDLVAFSGGLLEYDEKVQADPAVDKLVKDVVTKVNESLNVVIAKSEVDLDGDRNFVRKRETNVGNLVADIMLQRTKTIKGHEADVALANGGNIRTQLKAGDLTKKDLYTLLPFPNTLVIQEVSGEDLQAALENGVSQVEKGAGRFPQIAGMSFTYNPTKPAGQRVVEVKVGGQPLDPKKTYKLATNDFLAIGGDGYESLKKYPSFNTGFTLYNVVEEALIQMKTINPKVEGRIIEVK